MTKKTFENLLLIARPAAGKSEIIHYLKQTPLEERVERFHIPNFVVIDDFPMLYTWFEEDKILTEMGYPRLHTDEKGYFAGNHLWHLLVRRICLEYDKTLRDNPAFHQDNCAILEFSRGKESGGYREAFKHLSPQVLEKLAIMYIDVSYEESLRKNRARFTPDKPDSILGHSLPDEKMERLYKEDDFHELISPDSTFITIQGYQVPYAIFPNEDDVTTEMGAALGERLQTVLDELWQRWVHTR